MTGGGQTQHTGVCSTSYIVIVSSTLCGLVTIGSAAAMAGWTPHNAAAGTYKSCPPAQSACY
jgi:hypothetical protein